MNSIASRVPIAIRYLLSGGTAAAINLAVLYVLADIFGVWYLASSVVAFTLALVVSFLNHRRFTFHHTADAIWHKQFVPYMVITVSNIVLNAVLMYALVDLSNLHHMPAQIISSGLIAIESFFAYRHFVFHDQPPAVVVQEEIMTGILEIEQLER
jgi:putative flippase GtrA